MSRVIPPATSTRYWTPYGFTPRPQTHRSLGRYALLAVAILATNTALLETLTWVGLPLWVAKVLVELVLIPVSFAVQRRWVFAQRHQDAGTQPGAERLGKDAAERAPDREPAGRTALPAA
ncbi:GtrA family protein [Rothia sp. 11254D007CT]